MMVYLGTLKPLSEVVFTLDDNQNFKAPEQRTVYVKFEQGDGNCVIFRIMDHDLKMVKEAVLKGMVE